MAPRKIMPSIRETVITLQAGERKCWRHDSAAEWVRVERAALAHFRQEGWSGDSGKGKIVLALIKAASFTVLPATLHSRYIESIYSNNPGIIDVREHNIKL